MRSAIFAGFFVLSALSSGASGCGRVAAAPEHGAATAKAALVRLGEQRFEVVSFQPGAGRPLVFTDDYLFETRLYALDVEARIRYLTALRALGPSPLDQRIGLPGWSILDTDEGLQLFAVAGPGEHAAGEISQVQATAVFDEMAPGRFRFRNFDRRH